MKYQTIKEEPLECFSDYKYGVWEGDYPNNAYLVALCADQSKVKQIKEALELYDDWMEWKII